MGRLPAGGNASAGLLFRPRLQTPAAPPGQAHRHAYAPEERRRGVPFFLRRYRGPGRPRRRARRYSCCCSSSYPSASGWCRWSGNEQRVRATKSSPSWQKMGVREAGGRRIPWTFPPSNWPPCSSYRIVAWLTVNLSGSIARVEVERTHPPLPDAHPTPTAPPTSRPPGTAGSLSKLEVYRRSRQRCRTGDAVVEGMLLVSGVVERYRWRRVCKPFPEPKMHGAETEPGAGGAGPLEGDSGCCPTGKDRLPPHPTAVSALHIPLVYRRPASRGSIPWRNRRHPLMANGPAPCHWAITQPQILYSCCPRQEMRHEPKQEAAALAGKPAGRPKGAGGAGRNGRIQSASQHQAGDGQTATTSSRGAYVVHRGHRRGGTDPTGLSIADNCHGHYRICRGNLCLYAP